MSSPQPEMVRLSIAGLEHATTRYRAAVRDPAVKAEGVFIPLSEALFWACSTDEVLEKMYGDAYTEARASDPADPYVRGLRFARNRCTHQLALVAERAHLAPPLRPPITVGLVFRWRPLADLPTPDPRHQNGMTEYSDYLAGDSAESTVDRVGDWLHRSVERFA